MSLSLSRRAFVLSTLVLAAGLSGCGASGSAGSAATSASSSASASASSSTSSCVTSASGTYASGTHHATIEIEGYGTIALELDADSAPVTVSNFAKLANEGFYDGLTFHRIIQGFMMQGGDPKGNGTGGSGETIVGEFSDNGIDNPIKHVRGTISMARSSAMDSASSQFFIMQEDADYLDGQYAAFGHVTDGLDVVDAICDSAKPSDNNGTIAPADQPKIVSIRVEA